LQSDFEIQHAERIKACSTPQLLATGSLQEISSLAHIAEGIWYSCHIKRKYYNQHYYACLLAAYFVFNAEYCNGLVNIPRAYSAGKDWSNSANRCWELSSTIVKNTKCVVDYRTQARTKIIWRSIVVTYCDNERLRMHKQAGVAWWSRSN
jgi:hypothetical protein